MKLFSCLVTLGSLFAGEVVLFDPASEGVGAWSAADTSLSKTKNGSESFLQVVTTAGKLYPSAILKNSGGWDLSSCAILEIAVRNPESEIQTIYARVDSAPKTGDAKSVVPRQYPFRVGPGETKVLRFFLRPYETASGLKSSDFFGMMGTPLGGVDALYTENIQTLILFIQKPLEARRFEIGKIAARGEASKSWATMPENPFPLIDRFGQFKHREWPGKTHSENDLKTSLASETADLAANARPADWDAWGGSLDGPSLKTSGFFRVEKTEGRWQLVDPDGKLFFSLGLNCVRPGNHTPIAEREKWFETLPEEGTPAFDFFRTETSSWNGYYYKGKTFKTFNFNQWNLQRKYGVDWKGAFGEITLKRLPSWGLNTIGNWSVPWIYEKKKIPYTVNLETSGKTIGGSGAFGRFNDPFDSGFARLLQDKLEKENASSIKDPWCIGYFVDNEIPWGDEAALGQRALATAADRAGKQAAVDELKRKYPNVAALNRVWETDYDSWESLASSDKPPAPEKAWSDLTNLTRLVADRYFKTVRDVLRESAPDHLYLGCRYSGFGANPVTVMAASRYCDVVSFNVYEPSPKDQPLIAFVQDKPVMIGEFHFGALDRGQFHGGCSPVQDQAERSAAFRSYVIDALRHPLMVGCHWFQYVDSPTTGRAGDGENYQIGFVDNCDTVYPEIAATSRQLGKELYKIRLGK